LRSISVKAEKNDVRCPADIDLIKEIIRRGYPIPIGSKAEPDEISARQGSSLAALLLGGNYCWNFNDGSESIHTSSNFIFNPESVRGQSAPLG
jgi:hypothetical protein